MDVYFLNRAFVDPTLQYGDVRLSGSRAHWGDLDSPSTVLSMLMVLLLVCRAVLSISGATSHMCLTEVLKHGQSGIQLVL